MPSSAPAAPIEEPLASEEPQHLATRRPGGAEQADLAHPLPHRHGHRVRDQEGPDDEGHQPEQEGDRREGGLSACEAGGGIGSRLDDERLAQLAVERRLDVRCMTGHGLHVDRHHRDRLRDHRVQLRAVDDEHATALECPEAHVVDQPAHAEGRFAGHPVSGPDLVPHRQPVVGGPSGVQQDAGRVVGRERRAGDEVRVADRRLDLRVESHRQQPEDQLVRPGRRRERHPPLPDRRGCPNARVLRMAAIARGVNPAGRTRGHGTPRGRPAPGRRARSPPPTPGSR